MSWRVKDVMRTGVHSVAPDTSLAHLERSFLDLRVGGFPVVEDGKVVGLVSRSDVVRQLSVEQSLAETIADYYRGAGVEVEAAESLEEIGERVGRKIRGLCVRDVMVPKVLSVSPEDLLSEVARRMVEKRIHRFPVLSEGSRLVGIITSLDFVTLFAEGRVVPVGERG